MSILLQDHQVILGYNEEPVLRVQDFHYSRGERWVLLGPNGAGKSTFLRSIFDPELTIKGKREVLVAPHEIASIPQAPRFSHQMPCQVYDFLLGSIGLATSVWKPIANAARSNILRVLDRVELAGLEKCWISSLSGGQVQRLLIARAILLEAKIYVLDEPFSAVQGDSKLQLIRLLDDVAPHSLQFFALHDPLEISQVRGELIQLADGKMNILNGRIPAAGDADVVTVH